MVIEIDTINKTITLKQQIKFCDLVKELESLNIDLKEYSLKNDMVYSYYPNWFGYQNQCIGNENGGIQYLTNTNCK